jgi:Spy/CpxP family protein refolding chaperone
MEPSSGQQRLLFVVVVLVLAGLGVYLISARTHNGTAATPPASPSATSPATQAPATSPASQAPATTPASPPASVPTGGGKADIYQWLPFSQQDLTEAARTTVAFAADYETYSYTETAAAYVGKMASLATGELAATLKNAYATPGVAAQRSAQKQISTSSGGIASIRSFGPGSITFVVNIAQQLATTQGTSTKTTQYAVTLVSAAGGWQVNDIELAGAGNQ